VRPDGKVEVQRATYALDDLKLKLEELGLVAPQQPLVVNGQGNATRAEIKRVVALCHEAKLPNVTVAKATPPTALAMANEAAPATSDMAPPAQKLAHTSHLATSSAPISTGPQYTVP
jgi:thiazole synthase ThiGH ThiG subunit